MDNSQRTTFTHQSTSNYGLPNPVRRMSAVQVLTCTIFESATFYASYYIYKNWKWPHTIFSAGILAANAFLIGFIYLKLMRQKQLPSDEHAGRSSSTTTQILQQTQQQSVRTQTKGALEQEPSTSQQTTKANQSETKETAAHQTDSEKYEALLSPQQAAALANFLIKGFVPKPTDVRAWKILNDQLTQNRNFSRSSDSAEIREKIAKKEELVLKAFKTVGEKHARKARELQNAGKVDEARLTAHAAAIWIGLPDAQAVFFMYRSK